MHTCAVMIRFDVKRSRLLVFADAKDICDDLFQAHEFEPILELGEKSQKFKTTPQQANSSLRQNEKIVKRHYFSI